jgi:hypothetical protein
MHRVLVLYLPPEDQAVMADIPNYATGAAVVLNYPVQEAQLG